MQQLVQSAVSILYKLIYELQHIYFSALFTQLSGLSLYGSNIFPT